jgi:predicted N-acetyltransferase YhbS
MTCALQALREQGAAGCVLLGDPNFYHRFGFRAQPGIRLPNAPPEHFLAMSFGPKLPCGAVSYQAAFNVPGK